MEMQGDGITIDFSVCAAKASLFWEIETKIEESGGNDRINTKNNKYRNSTSKHIDVFREQLNLYANCRVWLPKRGRSNYRQSCKWEKLKHIVQ